MKSVWIIIYVDICHRDRIIAVFDSEKKALDYYEGYEDKEWSYIREEEVF